MGTILGRGWAFPIRANSAGSLSWSSDAEKVRQSIWLIVSTAQGERLMRPAFGCGIHELVFETNSAALRSLVEQKVREALTRWEPRIDVTEVSAQAAPGERNHLLIKIDYRLRANNAFYNLVYPFFLTEGPS